MSLDHTFAEYRSYSEPVSEALSALAARHHAFASFFFERGIKLLEVPPGDPLAGHIKTACATMDAIFLNVDFFASLDIHERVGVVIHEIAHVMMGHPAMMRYWHDLGHVPSLDNSKQLALDLDLMNIAMDAIINPWIIDSRLILPQNRVSFPWVTPDMAVLTAYEKLLENPPPPPPMGGAGGQGDEAPLPGGGTLLPSQPGRGQHAMAGHAETEAEAQARKLAVEGAMAAGTAAGTLPGSMKEALGKILEAKIKWQDVLRDAIVTCAGNDRLNHKRMNRRRFLLTTEVASSRRSERVGTIFFLFDTSGSVNKFLVQFLSEVASVCEELEPKEIVVMWVDTHVRHVDVLEDASARDVAALTIHGGGGTDLRKGFDYIAEHGPEGDQTHDECIACVVLTDSETAWIDRDPGYPVICATTGINRQHPDFFRLVDLK
jgi:predicted metal-dependent peptidase